MHLLPLILLACLISIPSWGRIFDINKESFAPYVLFGGSQSSIGSGPYSSETSQDLSYSSGVSSINGGEFGFVYAQSWLSFRFGFEVLRPQAATVSATNSSGTSLYTVSSEVLGYIPKVGFEINLHNSNYSRSFVSMTYGAATFTFKNTYLLTAEGQTAFSGVPDYSADLKGSSQAMTATLGYERHLLDVTTLVVEFGYRMLKVNNWTYSKDVTTLSGAQTTGSPWKDVSGNQRELDFSGALINLGFRFYF